MVFVFGGFRTFRRGDPCVSRVPKLVSDFTAICVSCRPDRYYRDAVSRRGEPVCPPENHHPLKMLYNIIIKEIDSDEDSSSHYGRRTR